MPEPIANPFTPLYEALRSAPTAPEAKGAADRLAREISKAGPQSLQDNDVLKTLHTFATNKKSGYERESAAIAFHSIANILGAPVAPLLLPSLQVLFELYMDKGDVVRSAATAAVKAILKLFPPESTRIVFDTLVGILEAGKWRTKVGVLDAFKSFVTTARDVVAAELGNLLPKVENAMHDTKQEVSTAAVKSATSLCTTLANPDLAPHIPALVKCMAEPDSVPACIKSLSSTTFVAEVTAPALAVLVPLLLRALNDRSMEVQRRTVVVIDNLVKLVRDPKVAATYLSPLVEGVQKIATTAAFPEVRAFADIALKTLLKSGASANGPPPSNRDREGEKAAASTTLVSQLPADLTSGGAPKHTLLAQSLEFQASLVADLVYARKFTDKAAWDRCVGVYLSIWSDAECAAAFAEAVRSHYHAIDKSKYAVATTSSEEGEVLCDTLFSLAYGALLLLSHTTLRLIRGRRYGILGPNGAGKSTLMRQLKEGKVENFPPQDQLRCVMVEHSLQGEDASLSVLDFIAADKALADVPRAKIRDQLLEVGFDDARQADIVGGLSGGWKMKLELARAMLYNADLLLLDEPTNHLDKASVKWLEEYLIAHTNVTCLIVSHDSRFLDNVTTDIIHYESKKLVYYPGNLSAFVEKHPDAKSYYTLAATTVKFSFPPPGSLMGVRSNTRAILKLSNCTFTYPGRTTPSLYNVSCSLSLSSRVGVVGPNGAGKSTLIKLLTGETVPQEGTVYKHPSLRVGYVSQHATHHIERHLEKTPIGYIQWRFQDGHDRELLEKATRVLTPEEQRVFDIDWVGKDGSKRKLEMVLGRQKLRKSFQYEVKWRGLDHKFNTWVSRDDLLAKGFTKVVQQFDDLESSREGAGMRETAAHLVRKHLEQIGLDGDIAQYNEISGLSGGQKIKLVIAACLWNNPQICVLDEPSNFLDREALGGLAVAIKEWAGAVVIISHNNEFVSALCPEIWNVEAGRMTQQGKTAVVEDAFADNRSPKGSGTNTPVRSRLQSPAASASATPVASGDEASGMPVAPVVRKKKKMTRNQLKAQEERRRLRKLRWLNEGGPRPEDTDDEDP
ncbi:putative chromo (CHRromatin Organisation MOdifier) domain containing protein [Lyophyllum shimeji]|uniref:Elongation factor 3 n=1 Tax=Lyophyllum shimeji TaxID=47721 RepID=A0A9P3UK41_LYOSH|nr:putative chromo (CHRromatin Organisation MOdifier) domain containing protein [Lyophyllum shimeji]